MAASDDWRDTVSWTCNKCATKHDTDEERKACRRAERALGWLSFGMLLAIVVLLAGVSLAWHSYAYGDWKCAFMECRKVVP
jgi:hypothetical protein